MRDTGIYHTHPFLIQLLNQDERVDPDNAQEFGMPLPPNFGILFSHCVCFVSFLASWQRLWIATIVLGEYTWEPFEVLQP